MDKQINKEWFNTKFKKMLEKIDEDFEEYEHRLTQLEAKYEFVSDQLAKILTDGNVKETDEIEDATDYHDEDTKVEEETEQPDEDDEDDVPEDEDFGEENEKVNDSKMFVKL